jgi:hypothetical protein
VEQVEPGGDHKRRQRHADDETIAAEERLESQAAFDQSYW